MTGEKKSDSEEHLDPWQQHQLSQLRYFRSLTLREKLETIEGMADIVHRLEIMRKQGGLKSGDGK